MGRAIVLVKDDQLSLAIGRRGQNVRLASKLVGWDIEIMTMDELNEGIERAEMWFTQIPGVTSEHVERFIEEGFMSFDDLTFLEPAELAEIASVSEEDAEGMILFAEEMAEQVEKEKELAAQEELAGRRAAAEAPPAEAPAAEGEAPAEGEAAPAEGEVAAEQMEQPSSEEAPAVLEESQPVSEEAALTEAPPEGEAALSETVSVPESGHSEEVHPENTSEKAAN